MTKQERDRLVNLIIEYGHAKVTLGRAIERFDDQTTELNRVLKLYSQILDCIYGRKGG